MHARFLDQLTPFDWPLAGDLAAACGRVADHRAALLPAERAAAASFGGARAAAYSSGRRVARAALDAFGLADQPILARAARPRRPVWPPGVVGSIAHSRCLAAALVGRRSGFGAIGLDAEPRGRVTERLALRVLTEQERAELPCDGWRTLLFSAKEAVYKAVNPLTDEYLAFSDVYIAAARSGRFAAAATKPCAAAAPIAAGEGFFVETHGHWLTMFVCRSQARRPFRSSPCAGETPPCPRGARARDA